MKVLVAADLDDAAALAGLAGLPGDHRHARAHLRLGVALAALPRADRLLQSRPGPPATWLSTFIHEAVHLLDLEYPILETAPRWFREGWAESFALRPLGRSGDRWTLDGQARLAAFREAWRAAPPPRSERVAESVGWGSDELQQTAWLHLAVSLEQEPGQRPWTAGRLWTWKEVLKFHPFEAAWEKAIASQGEEAAAWLLGREFDPPGGESPALLATYPLESVHWCAEVDWPAARLEPGWTADFRMRVGNTGLAEGALLVEGEGSHRLRIRVGRSGGFAAALEEKSRPRAHAFVDLTPGGLARETPRAYTLVPHGAGLLVRSEGQRRSFDYEVGRFAPPFRILFEIYDGALEITLPE